MSNALRWTEEELRSVQARGKAKAAPGAKAHARPAAKRVNAAEDLLGFQLTSSGIPFTREFRFHPNRKFRADYSLGRILVEIDGGLFIDGGHSRGRARMNDMKRDAEALVLGFTVLRVPPDWIKTGQALGYIKKLMGIAA